MRIGRIANRAVLVDGETALDLERASDGRIPADPVDLFENWDTLAEWAATAKPDGERLPLDQLQNPVPAPRQVFGIGANYRDHL
ncbi:MAG TPA: FAA hydrolase family protein, partial [Acidimicrobiales bacterium]